MDNNTKTILFVPTEKEVKKINYEKEKKMRVETKTWGLNEEELTNETQLNIIKTIPCLLLNNEIKKNTYCSMFITHIKTKIGGYKQQDILKKKHDEVNFVSLECVLDLLNDCELKCHYCSQDIYILYEHVRDMKQWTLDRINNDIGHNNGNLVVSCLECNLKRRRTNKDSFMFTKNMKIIRQGIN